MGIKKPTKWPFCSVCVEAKSTKHPLGPRELPLLESPRPAHTFAADVAGPFPTPTQGGARYFLVLVCVYSRRLFVSMMTSTSEFVDIFRDMVHHLEADFARDRVVARLHTDGGTYFNSTRLADFCRLKGILQTSSAPYTPSLNGVAERAIRTLIEMCRAMLVQSKAPHRLFGEAIIYASYVLNVLPMKAGMTESRMDKWEGQIKQRHFHIKPFGCAAWMLEPHPQNVKLESKGTLCILVGYEYKSNCYRLATLPNFVIIRSAHVTFNEMHFPCAELNIPKSIVPEFPTDPIVPEQIPQREEPESARRSPRSWQPSFAALESWANRE